MTTIDTGGEREPAADTLVQHDMAPGLRVFLLIDGIVRLLIWCGAFAVASALLAACAGWPATSTGPAQACAWAWRLVLWILCFNAAYVLLLLLLRLPIPMPREGRYRLDAARLAPDVLWSCLIAVLTKARLDPPFPGFLVFHLANLPPLHWLMGPIFGPRSKSCYVTDPRIIDPHLVTIGRNVVIGLDATITGHVQQRGYVDYKRTVIEDGALIGGHAAVPGGVHVGRGAVIGAGAIVKPDTIIGPNEYWAGVPAQFVRVLDDHATK